MARAHARVREGTRLQSCLAVALQVATPATNAEDKPTPRTSAANRGLSEMTCMRIWSRTSLSGRARELARCVPDGKPWRFRVHVDVLRRLDPRIVVEGSATYRHHLGPEIGLRVDRRAALRTEMTLLARAGWITLEQGLASHDGETRSRDQHVRRKRTAARLAAHAAMADVHRPRRFAHLVADCPAKTRTPQHHFHLAHAINSSPGAGATSPLRR